MARSYVPDAGDIVWISFDPQAGHEQAGHRPAVVLSPAAYNAKTSLIVCCPMTTQIKNYPFEVSISGANPSAVLADQVKSLDWRKRRATRKGTISSPRFPTWLANSDATSTLTPPMLGPSSGNTLTPPAVSTVTKSLRQTTSVPSRKYVHIVAGR
jgi:mRNA interferase MazF